MFGVDAVAVIHTAHVKEVKNKKLAVIVLEWWEENKDEMYIDSLDRDCDYKLYPKEPEFVKLAKELING
jgi:hypothetical protein